MLLVRMRLEVLKRESRTAWAKAEVKALVEKAR
ncbi:heme ABC transporter permease, partial [Pseudomonas aeruginosa]